jgi:hypothetical protein
MPPSPDQAQCLVPELHALQRLPDAAADRAVHARKLATAGKHQRDGMLGDRGIAVALDGVHFDAKPIERGDIHVTRRAGAEENDVL